MMLYMLRTVFPSFIRSSRLYIQKQANACFYMYSLELLMYSLELLMMDVKTVRNM